MRRDVGSDYEDRGKVDLFELGAASFVVEYLLQPTVVGMSLGGGGGRMRAVTSAGGYAGGGGSGEASCMDRRASPGCYRNYWKDSRAAFPEYTTKAIGYPC